MLLQMCRSMISRLAWIACVPPLEKTFIRGRFFGHCNHACASLFLQAAASLRLRDLDRRVCLLVQLCRFFFPVALGRPWIWFGWRSYGCSGWFTTEVSTAAPSKGIHVLDCEAGAGLMAL